MNRIYCAVGKIMELTQDLEESVGEICKNSEIIKEFARNILSTFRMMQTI